MIHHPAFQSLGLPLLLALLGIAALRAGLGPRHAAWGGLLALLGALAWWPGFEWPAPTRTQKLPWIVLAGLGFATLDTLRAGIHRGLACGLAWLAWMGAGLWLADGHVGPPALAAAALFGGAVLFLLGWGRGEPAACRAVAAAVLTLASLGLTGLAATGGSMLLAQLALMLASALAAVVGWSWLRPASGLEISPALLMAFGLSWLAIAWCWVLAAPSSAFAVDSTRAARVATLALAFVVPALLSWRGETGRAPPWLRWAALALSAVPVALALAWPGGDGSAPTPDTATDPDDPYLTPSWR